MLCSHTKMEPTLYFLSNGNHGNEILTTLESYFHQGLFTDIILVSSDGIEHKAHKVLLAVASPIFYEKVSKIGEKCPPAVYLEDVSGDVLKELLSVIYTGKVTLSDSNFSAMQHLARRYTIVGLDEICKKFALMKEKASNGHGNGFAFEVVPADQKSLECAFGDIPLNVKLEPVDPEADNNLAEIVQEAESLMQRSGTLTTGDESLDIKQEDVSPISSSDHNSRDCYPCKICGKLYPFSSCLKLHMRRHERFTNRSRDISRMVKRLDHSKKKSYKCSLCKKQKKTKCGVVQHIQQCHFKGLSCKKCRKTFRSFTLLQDHMYQRHRLGFRLARNSVCLNCGRVFRHSKLAAYHVPCDDAHVGHFSGTSDSLRCTWCLQKFKHTKLLHRHQGFCSLRIIKNPRASPDNTNRNQVEYGLGHVINITPIEEMQSPGIQCQDHDIEGPLRRLFEDGVLGDSSPKQLLETVLFMVNHFLVPLRWISWKKGSKLFHSQIKVLEEADGSRSVAFYEGRESIGGIFLEREPRVKLLEKRNNPYCFVNLVAKYISLIPGVYSHGSPIAFFLTPKSTWSENSWFNQANLGIRSISQILKRIYKCLPPDLYVNEDWPRGNMYNYQYNVPVPTSIIQGSINYILNIHGYTVVRSKCLSDYQGRGLKGDSVNRNILIQPNVRPLVVHAPPPTIQQYQLDSSSGMGGLTDTGKTSTDSDKPQERTPSNTQPSQPPPVPEKAEVKAEENIRAIAAECTRIVWGVDGESSDGAIPSGSSDVQADTMTPHDGSRKISRVSPTKRWQECIPRPRDTPRSVPKCVAKLNDWLQSAKENGDRQRTCERLGIEAGDNLTDLSSSQVFFLLSHILQTDTESSGIKSLRLEGVRAFYNKNSRNPVDSLTDSDMKDISSRKSFDLVGKPGHGHTVYSDIQLFDKGVLVGEDPKSLAKLVCYLLSASFKMNAENLRNMKRMAVALDEDERGSYVCVTLDTSSIFLHQRIHTAPINELDELVKEMHGSRLKSPSLKVYSNPEHPGLCLVTVLNKYLCKSNSWEKTLILKPGKFWNNNIWYQQSVMGVSTINALLNEVASSKLLLQNCCKGSLSSLQHAHRLEANLRGMTVEECEKCTLFLAKTSDTHPS